jgi:hypothetical protein
MRALKAFLMVFVFHAAAVSWSAGMLLMVGDVSLSPRSDRKSLTLKALMFIAKWARTWACSD